MKKLAIIFLFIFSIGSVFSAPKTLKLDDIPGVMERFFSFHIEHKQLNPTIVKRCVKLYIEQFDPDKSYLLSSEVAPYLNMSDAKAEEIIQHLKNRNYSDFIAMNGMMQEAVVRAQSLRVYATRDLVQNQSAVDHANLTSSESYAANENDLMDRQKGRMVRFFLYHKARTNLGTADRRRMVFELFEKRVKRGEDSYLFLSQDSSPMANGKVESLVTLRILKAFAKSLDTHTSFFSPEEAYEMRMSLEKKFEGVGVILSEGIDGVMIAELIKGSPAEQSGQIQVNDVLVEIDGVATAKASFEDVLEMMKKKDRGEMVLGFKREDAINSDVVRVALRKKPLAMDQQRVKTSYERVGDGIVGKITLYSFYENGDGISSERDIKDAINSFREQGNLVGLILDLRENSGGFLSQAVKVSGLFLSNGVVVISKYGQGEVHYLRNIVPKAFYNGPLVVLTSKMSASASEIVAQTLQDYGVALVVGGERTFGKGSIQYQTVTDGKADMFFKVTVGRYYTASGKSPQITGVLSDIVIPTPYDPYKVGEKYLEYPLPTDRVEAAFIDPLTDLDEKTRNLFQMRYLPHCQRVVSYWQKMLPELRRNSAYRIKNDLNFQIFLKKQEAVYARADSLPVNTIDEPIQVGQSDMQMNEAVNIVKDMIIIDAENSHPEELSLTGTGD